MIGMKRTMFLALVLACACQRQQPVQKPAGKVTTNKPSLEAAKSDLRNANIDTIISPVPAFLDGCGIGSGAAADGTVTGQQTEFKPADHIYLTMRFHDSPPGLQARMLVYGRGRKLLNEERRQMNGAKVVTFMIPQSVQKPSQAYHVEGYWGGNIACEYDVVVLAK
jgi:hypothetical protein